MKSVTNCLLLCTILSNYVYAFAPKPFPFISKTTHLINTELFGGTGTANNYSWKEDQYEIELKVKVPKATTAKQINYKAKSRSIHLTLGKDEEILLDGSRKMRGMIDLDGTFWSILDSEEHDGRDVVVTIEKLILPPKDPFEVVEFDWSGIYPDDEDEIVQKQYDEPEPLDVREYAASLGVDIDNINMTMVDKSMFSSGLNMTRNAMEELTKTGYAKEITRQNDGTETEFIDQGDGDGKAKATPFSAYGENVSQDEIMAAGIEMDGFGSIGGNGVNPYMTKESPWLQSMPAEEARTGEEEAPFPVSEGESKSLEKGDVDATRTPTGEEVNMQDPIDLLTVVKLKEILKREDLKLSGNKKELQDRLKGHVQSVMKGKQEGDN